MNWFTQLFSAGVSTLVDSIGNLADRFIESDDEKSAFKIQVEKLLQQRDSEIERTIRAELSAKEKIMIAELKHGDTYTKRARKVAAWKYEIAIPNGYDPLIGVVLSKEDLFVPGKNVKWTPLYEE